MLLVKILYYCDCYSPAELLQAINFVKCAFLSYIDPDLDLDFIIASIIAARQKDPKQFTGGIKMPAFNAKKK